MTAVDFSSDLSLWQRLKQVAKLQLYSGKLWKDILLIFFLVSLQESFMSQLTLPWRIFDLVTPWVTVAFVIKSFHRALFLAMVAALALETHSLVPAGTYIMSYWVIGVVIYSVHQTFSWRRGMAWWVTILISCSWVGIVEVFIALVLPPETAYDYRHMLALGCKLLFSFGFGVWLANHWLWKRQSEDSHLEI